MSLLAIAAIHGVILARVTWYSIPGPMRNGEQYDPLAYTCAVDATEWQRLRGRTLILKCGGETVEVVVTDSGWLGEGNLDLSPAAFAQCGDLEDGVAWAIIEGG